MNLEIINEKLGKYKKVAIAAGIIIVLSIPYSIGSSATKTELNGEMVNYEELAKEVEKAEGYLKDFDEEIDTARLEIKEVKSDLDSVNREYTKRKSEYDEAKIIAEQKDTVLNEITTLNSQMDGKKNELATLDTTIQTKKDELAKLESAIIVKNEEPVQLPAGTLIVGKDIKVGRYKVLPVGRGSNFKVYDSTGSNLYNTIISSTPDHGVPEYVVFLGDGNIIEANSPFKYVPVE
jgi:predicted RNase H-like nuclease (RuvC/YqgF family)